nr:MAG TPA: hypothetical protein [Caudoviricetes sp.]DAS54912.1 MAG TPA: hypothetical protein [Caudoviricetes sp.]
MTAYEDLMKIIRHKNSYIIPTNKNFYTCFVNKTHHTNQNPTLD